MSERVIGPYTIKGLLGSGGTGHVYYAIDEDLGREVALKALRPELSDDPDLVGRFRNEAANLARLNHPNITMLYSLYRETIARRQSIFLVMEMVNGETIEAILARFGRLDVPTCLAIMSQAIAALSYAHSVGIIHRDIKPSNLMLNQDGLLKITDFGIARAQGSERLTRHGAVVGTLNYIAPEQIRGQESDNRSDLYSLACVLYKLLSGRSPFAGLTEYELIQAQLETQPEPLTAALPELGAQVNDAVMRALAKRPEDRYATLDEFGEALGAMSSQEAARATIREHVLVQPPNPTILGERLLHDESGGTPHSLPAELLYRAAADTQHAPLAAAPRGATRPSRRLALAACAVVALLAGGTVLAVRANREAGTAAPSSQPDQSNQPAAAVAAPDSPPAMLALAERALPQPAVVTSAEALQSPPQASFPVPDDAVSAMAISPLPAPAAGSNPRQVLESPLLPPAPGEQPPDSVAASQKLTGTVSNYSADGLPVIDGITLHLDGIGPLAPNTAKSVAQWIVAHGNYLECNAAQPSLYRCVTKRNLDLAEAILLNGAARTSADAPTLYRVAEAKAHNAKRGVWK